MFFAILHNYSFAIKKVSHFELNFCYRTDITMDFLCYLVNFEYSAVTVKKI